MFQGYRLTSKSRSVTIARTALERRGVDPVETSTGGGSDANAFNAAGFETRAARQRDRGEPHAGGERRS